VSALASGRPLFSVVLLLYNQARFVEEALASVRDQTWDPIELLVCDDASTDGSADLAERWALENGARFARWKVLRQEKNRGILPNQLAGIRESRGEYVKTLAADDLLLPEALEAAADFFGREPGFGLACGGVQAFRVVEGRMELGGKSPRRRNLPLFSLPAELQYRALATRRYSISAPSVFARRAAYERIDLASTGIRLYNDYPTWLSVTLEGFRFGLIGKDTVLYRKSPSSVSQNLDAHGPKMRRRWETDHFKVYRAIVLPNRHRLSRAERIDVRCRALKAQNCALYRNRPLKRLASWACLFAMSAVNPLKWKALALSARRRLGAGKD
jgi:glycosyltransferase involved in cell wall biosynthesis